MATYLSAIAGVFVMLIAWIVVSQAAQLFARRHPEFGRFREKVGCGDGCCGSQCADEATCDSRTKPVA
jgi:hypothetical protein